MTKTWLKQLVITVGSENEIAYSNSNGRVITDCDILSRSSSSMLNSLTIGGAEVRRLI